MVEISRFEVKNLHGKKTLDIPLIDNTLILVGENGANKTTLLHLFFYMVSGQWRSMAKYKFDSVSITINQKKHTIRYDDITKVLQRLDVRLLNNFPPSLRRRVTTLLEQTEGHMVSGELERLCEQYGIPIQYLLREIDFFDYSKSKNSERLTATLKSIQSSLNCQIIYLPTYRRIEHELNLIFKGLDDRELATRRSMLNAKRQTDTHVELVEFGMKDVESAVNKERAELEKFARDNLTNLTFTYLGDIVEQKYKSAEFDLIKSADPATIQNILNRVPESILSSSNKTKLKGLINKESNNKPDEIHSKVIFHYFMKLMEFHQELESRESKIVNFCRICNEYMADKTFLYDTTNYTFKIMPKESSSPDDEITLQQLSSGEKQIASLFSHLYLSGGTSYFLLIDEPELSLSVVWQRRFLDDIKDATFCAGLIAVTHSPFIYENKLRRYAHGLDEFVV